MGYGVIYFNTPCGGPVSVLMAESTAGYSTNNLVIVAYKVHSKDLIASRWYYVRYVIVQH